MKLIAILAGFAAGSPPVGANVSSVPSLQDFMRFPPKGSEHLLFTEKDGLPHVDIESFQNDCPICPTQIDDGTNLVAECVDGTHGWKTGGCACGTPSNRHEKSCHKCTIEHLRDQKNRPEEFKCPIMSRRQIVERALGYVLLGARYHSGWSLETCASDDVNPNCPAYGFEAVCNGFIDMAWSGGPQTCQEKIPCNQMQPGDHIHTKNHQMLFRKWRYDDHLEENGHPPHANHRSAVVYQMGGGWGKANVGFHKTEWGQNDTIVGSHCFRRKNLTDSTPAPYPPFPPAPAPPSPTPPSPTPPSPTPPSPTPPSPTPGQCLADLREKTCSSSPLIQKVSASNLDECCAACQSTDGCTHFTFTPGAESCGLKTGALVESKHDGCTSGVMQGPSPTPTPSPEPTPSPPPTPTPTPGQCLFEKRENTCFEDDNLDKVVVDSIEKCCEACRAQDGCTHFTFTESASTCGMKAGEPVDHHKHTHCTSGVMQNSMLVPSHQFV